MTKRRYRIVVELDEGTTLLGAKMLTDELRAEEFADVTDIYAQKLDGGTWEKVHADS